MSSLICLGSSDPGPTVFGAIVKGWEQGRVAQIESYRNDQGQLWLNVASSTYAIKDFVNLDNHVFLTLSKLPKHLTSVLPRKYQGYIQAYRDAGKVGPLLRHDCRKPLDLPDGVADHILCSHFLEHVYPDETDAILKDFHRVLKPGGTLHVIVPDISQQISAYLMQREAGDINAADKFVKETLLTTETRGTRKYRLLEALGAFGLQHRWMYDQPSIRMKVEKAGFKILDKNETPSRTFREGDDSAHVVGRKA